jgi:hypothetical protein
MTSPVDTSVKNFNSTMSGAPVLNGTAGSLVALLDAVLKDGFDTKTLASLVIAGGIATASWVGSHSAQAESVILVAGVTGGPTGWAGLNGEQKVIAKATLGTSVTFPTTLPDGTATGTITIKMAPLGWLKPFTGASLGAYKSADVASSGMLLRVDDTGTQFARVRGFESMSDINTGLGPFPTDAQMSGGGYWTKSNVATTAAVPWAIHGDGRIFYFTATPGIPSGGTFAQGVTRVFGDMIALRPAGDPFACYLNYSNNVNAPSQIDGGAGSSGDSLRFAAPRDYTGLGSAVVHGKYPYTYAAATSVSGIAGVLGTFPSVVDGTLMTSRQFVASGAATAPPRADFPGVYHCGQSGVWDTFKFLDTAPAAGALAGRTLQALTTANTTFPTASTSANTGVLMVDRTGPWR